MKTFIVADVSTIVAQAMATYKTINDQQNKVFADQESSKSPEEPQSRYESLSSDYESITSNTEKPPQ